MTSILDRLSDGMSVYANTRDLMARSIASSIVGSRRVESKIRKAGEIAIRVKPTRIEVDPSSPKITERTVKALAAPHSRYLCQESTAKAILGDGLSNVLRVEEMTPYFARTGDTLTVAGGGIAVAFAALPSACYAGAASACAATAGFWSSAATTAAVAGTAAASVAAASQLGSFTPDQIMHSKELLSQLVSRNASHLTPAIRDELTIDKIETMPAATVQNLVKAFIRFEAANAVIVSIDREEAIATLALINRKHLERDLRQTVLDEEPEALNLWTTGVAPTQIKLRDQMRIQMAQSFVSSVLERRGPRLFLQVSQTLMRSDSLRILSEKTTAAMKVEAAKEAFPGVPDFKVKFEELIGKRLRTREDLLNLTLSQLGHGERAFQESYNRLTGQANALVETAIPDDLHGLRELVTSMERMRRTMTTFTTFNRENGAGTISDDDLREFSSTYQQLTIRLRTVNDRIFMLLEEQRRQELEETRLRLNALPEKFREILPLVEELKARWSREVGEERTNRRAIDEITQALSTLGQKNARAQRQFERDRQFYLSKARKGEEYPPALMKEIIGASEKTARALTELREMTSDTTFKAASRGVQAAVRFASGFASSWFGGSAAQSPQPPKASTEKEVPSAPPAVAHEEPPRASGGGSVFANLISALNGLGSMLRSSSAAAEGEERDTDAASTASASRQTPLTTSSEIEVIRARIGEYARAVETVSLGHESRRGQLRRILAELQREVNVVYFKREWAGQREPSAEDKASAIKGMSLAISQLQRAIR